jgi:tetratricopeptide (TPR) repeat protein
VIEQAKGNQAGSADKSLAQELTDQGRLSYRQGELSEALAYLHRAHEQYRASNDTVGVAEAANDIGVLNTVMRRYDDAEQWLNDSHELFVSLQDLVGEAQTLGNLGSLAQARRDLKQAAAYLQQAADRFHLVGDDERRSATLKSLSVVRLRQLRFLQALAAYETALICLPRPTIWHRVLRYILSLPRRMM